MLGLWMFAAAVILLLIGYPVAFSLGGTAVLFTVFGSDFLPSVVGIDIPWEPAFRMARLNILPQRIYGNIMSNYTLVAVPFFVFMGVMLEKSGLAEDLLETMGILFGAVRGGLAISVVAVGALLAASTGVVGASVVTMGVLALPVMLKYNYEKPLATGVIASSGTLGQIIPPSIVLVILGDQIGVSVGALFVGAAIPGVMLALLFALWVFIYARIKPGSAPPLPPEARKVEAVERRWFQKAPLMIMGILCAWALLGQIAVGITGWLLRLPSSTEFIIQGIVSLLVLLLVVNFFATRWKNALLYRVVENLVPPLFLILLVLGSIFAGVATPTEAGAVGAFGAMCLAALRLHWFFWWLLSLFGWWYFQTSLAILGFTNIPVISDGTIILALFVIGILALWIAGRNNRFKTKDLKAATDQTVKLTSMVFIILTGATAFSMVFTALGGDRVVQSFLQNLPGGQWGFLFFSMLIIFLLGFFIDFIEITFIVVPLLAPIALQFFGLEMMVWFGVLIAMNLQASFLTPPFGFALFYLKGVAPPSIKTTDIYRGIIPFIIIQLVAVLLIAVFPQIVTWLPSLGNAQ